AHRGRAGGRRRATGHLAAAGTRNPDHDHRARGPQPARPRPAADRPRTGPPGLGRRPPPSRLPLGGTRMLTTAQIDRVVSAALAPWGGLPGQVCLPADATATAQLRARQDGVLSGLDVFTAAFRLTDPATRVRARATDGDRFAAGAELAVVSGPARAVVQAER